MSAEARPGGLRRAGASGAGRLAAALVLGLAGASGGAQAAPVTLRVCLNEVPHPPWRYADASGRVQRDGLDFLVLDLWAKRSGLKIETQLLPWKRCLADLKAGLQDAVPAMSFLAEREDTAVFPRDAQGRPDESLAIKHHRYSWYVLRGQGVSWDGHQLRGLAAELPVGAQSGYSVASILRGQGFRVDEAARTAEANLEKLLRRRVGAVALQEKEADRVLELRPALAAAVQRLQPALEVRAYYTVFSHEFAARSPVPLAKLWKDLAAVRDSPAFRQAEQDAMRRLAAEDAKAR